MLTSQKNPVALINSFYPATKLAELDKPRKQVFTPCIKGQCACVINFKSKLVTNHHGVTELLGYNAEEFAFDNLLGYVHPADAEILMRLIDAVAGYTSSHLYTADVTLTVTCRVRKKDASYIKILAQSAIHFIDNNDELVSYYTLFTDVSFMSGSINFEWKFEAPGLDEQKFRSSIQPNNKNLFSERELQVIDLISQGFTSNVIAHKLYVSKHTIDTHRRKMLYKTGCNNSVELLDYYRNNFL